MSKPQYDWSALWAGARGIFSLAGLVMCASFMGFGALVRGMGFELWPGLATTLLIWALPGQVVLLTLAREGAAMLAIALAVSFTAIRLLPMVTLVLSRVALPGAAKWPLYVLAHLIAVTLWILTGDNVKAMPHERQLPWLMGLGWCLVVVMLIMTTAGYYLTGVVPAAVAAAMAFMSPCFFFISLFSNAKARVDLLAVAGGVLLVPVFMAYAPQYDLVASGLIGGTVAYGIGRQFSRSA